jgi:hypothetical protein
MKYKKIFILPALFILSNILYISCCNCKKELFPHYTVTSIINTVYGSNNAIIDTGALTNVDSINIKYQFFKDCTAHKIKQNPFSFLVNESYACKCQGCGREGLKSKIATFNISSDSIYNGIPANTSLNNIFKIKENIYLPSVITIDSLKNVYNKNGNEISDIVIFTKTKPSNTKGHIFKLSISFEDGKILTTSTKLIYWQ